MSIFVVIFSGFALAGLAPWLHRRTGRATGWLLCALPAALFLWLLLREGPLAIEAGRLRIAAPWAPGVGLNLSFMADGLGLLFALLITGIGALVFIYASGYLTPGVRAGRLYCFLLLFMGSMLGLVLADNLLLLYLFWELTSISSYLLIGIDNERPAARAAAWQALLVTGAGGLSLLAGLLLLGQIAGTYELSQLLERGDLIRGHGLYVPALVLVLLGAFTKSAQFPFHFWLPAAMEAPTPVSAYLHSATMVKAGVYLLARLAPALGDTAAWHWGVIPVGAATMLVGGYMAINLTDLKRVLAFSTVSALGTLVLLLGVGTEAAVKAAVVFLVAHALYKGSLFMVAGAIDHETGTRDLDRLGGLKRAMPITAGVALAAALSLAGVGPMLGFIGKEMFLQALWAAESTRYVLVPVAILSGAMFVVVAWLVGVRPFFGRVRDDLPHAHEAPLALRLGPAMLAAGGVALGLFPQLLDATVTPAAASILARPVELHLSLWHGFNAALLLSGISLLGGAALYYFWVRLHRKTRMLERIVGWGPAQWYDAAIDGLNWLARVQTSVLQSGYLRYYLLTITATTVLLVGWPLLGRAGVPARGPSAVGIRFHEAILGALIVVAAVAAVRFRSRLAAIAALGVVGYGVGLIFILFGAPDLAMTQFLVETLIVILFVLVFYHLPHYTVTSSVSARLRDATIALLGGAMVTGLVLMATATPLDRHVADFFARHSYPDAHGRNVVNVILVDFRAMDTLGEITVLAIAAIGVYSLLKLRPRPARNRQGGAPPAFRQDAPADARLGAAPIGRGDS